VNISSEQRTTIKQTVVSSGGPRVSRSTLGSTTISVGVSVPRTVTVKRLPPRIVEIVPEYAEYSYFITDDDVIVIVDPDTYEIVYVIES
jgi:ABC-type Fe3+-hydroxamate transport system substrate-binding protein